MQEQLTPQQYAAVTNRGGRLLVSAAAGSGKTKVLVERLMGYMTDPADPANVDDFLIITYTKAAAAELRSKIASKLTEKLAQNPENRHLQRQMQRLYLANISTIHSFCMDVIRQYAYRLNISPDFRMADDLETDELKLRIADRVLEQFYQESDSDFIRFADTQDYGRNDSNLSQIIIDLYNKAQCHVNPDRWLAFCVDSFRTENVSDAGKTVWGEYLICDLKQRLKMHIDAFSNCIRQAAQSGNMEGPVKLFSDNLEQLESLYYSQTWDEIVAKNKIDYGRLIFKGKYDEDLALQLKAIRESCKKDLESRLRLFSDTSAQIMEDVAGALPAAVGLVKAVRRFTELYRDAKNSRRIVDYSDLEHMTLDLLVGKDRGAPTALAREIGDRFREVMVDEYQDCNEVQDRLFMALTEQKHNCFMVGDVKQSIYQFRLADPGIFLSKYKSYSTAETAGEKEGRRVMLTSNFRSSGGVIEAVNCVFSTCMSEIVGGLDYDEAEALSEGIPHVDIPDPEVSLYTISASDDANREEAAFVASEVEKLLDGKHMVRQNDVLRPASADDIVILLRSPGTVAETYRTALEHRGIRCSSGSGVDILQTEEIMILHAILQIIDNPLQDIPMTAVLSSRVFGFTADDLARLRAENKNEAVFHSLLCAKDEKSVRFVALLNRLRKDARLYTPSELIDHVIRQTDYDSIYSAMPDGPARLDNIRLFCRYASEIEGFGTADLGRFLRFLENAALKGVLTGGESSDGCVRIMSIHKSKGLEFPIVFLCGLSKQFNTSDSTQPVLLDTDMGLGLYCEDADRRIKYATIARHAIRAKILANNLSEELRVLYVAMTRARDRLIMTYSSARLDSHILDMKCRVMLSPPELMASGAKSAGDWVLISALHRPESKVLTGEQYNAEKPAWNMASASGDVTDASAADVNSAVECTTQEELSLMRQSLRFRYPFAPATQMPSKQTATQLKGRQKDQEASELTGTNNKKYFRKPSFVSDSTDPRRYGISVHTLLQYIDYRAISDPGSVTEEIERLCAEGLITPRQGEMIDTEAIAYFFSTPFGSRLKNSDHVLREFKFSILDDASRYGSGVEDEKILLQGVVDCAIIEPDGIEIVDFKSDKVTEDSVLTVAEKYRVQVKTYAHALSRIYSLPIKSAQLYFLQLRKIVSVV